MANGNPLMSEAVYDYELSELERSAIEEIKKYFTSEEHKFIFQEDEDGYSLIFAHSKLTKLPGCIKNLKNLVYIDFSFNNTREFPKILTKMPWLRKIKLVGNKISKIPKEIHKLNNLGMLDFGKNHFPNIPVEIQNINSLQYLDLGENQIKEIPDWIGTLNNLHTLNLSGNQIKNIHPEIEKLTNLYDLNLSRNKLKVVNNTPKSNSLKFLSCNYNLIKNFENVDIDYDKTDFQFYGNRIKSFHAVPKKSLKTLLLEISTQQNRYNDFDLSKTGQKLLKDLLNVLNDYYSTSTNLFIDEDGDRTDSYPLENFERFYNFYNKSTNEILQDLISKKSISLEEMERLVHESGLAHRLLLENNLPKDHPIFEMYNEEYWVRSKSGLKILI